MLDQLDHLAARALEEDIAQTAEQVGQLDRLFSAELAQTHDTHLIDNQRQVGNLNRKVRDDTLACGHLAVARLNQLDLKVGQGQHSQLIDAGRLLYAVAHGAFCTQGLIKLDRTLDIGRINCNMCQSQITSHVRDFPS